MHLVGLLLNLKSCFGSISVLPFDAVVIEMWFGTAACPALWTAHLTSVALDYRLDAVLLPAASSVSQTVHKQQWTPSAAVVLCCHAIYFVLLCDVSIVLTPTLQSVILYPGGSTFRRNIGMCLPECTVSCCM